MKNFLKVSLVVLVASVAFASCNKDDDEKTNYAVLSDTTLSITQGTLDYYGAEGEGYDITIGLLTETIVVLPNGLWTDQGSIIYFSTVSSSNDGVTSGEYTIDGLTNEFSIYESYYNLYFDYGNYTPWTEVVSGTVNVVRNESNYKISFDCIDENGDAVKGNFTGDFSFTDWTSKKMISPAFNKSR